MLPAGQSTWLGTESWQPSAATFQDGGVFEGVGLMNVGVQLPPTAGEGSIVTAFDWKPPQIAELVDVQTPGATSNGLPNWQSHVARLPLPFATPQVKPPARPHAHAGHVAGADGTRSAFAVSTGVVPVAQLGVLGTLPS